jgi:hypothetical protein
VTRQVNLWDYVDVTLSSILHHIAALILSVVATVWNTIVDTRIRTDYSLLADATSESQLRHRLHLETPTLILGQMPVELVASVQSHHIDKLLDHLYREEVARTIEQHTTIYETWLILDCSIWQLDLSLLALLYNRQSLAQSLRRTEETDRVVGID